jgi:hypothetical protein
MEIISITVTVRSAVLMHGHNGQLPGVPRAKEPHTNLCIHVCCIQHDLKCLNTDFVGSTNTRNICLILSTIYSKFIPVCACIDRGLSALIWPGPKMLIRPILLRNVGCISWYFRNKIPFLRHKIPYFHFTYTGVYYPLSNV